MDQFRPPKQWSLTESETITSYANWQSNMLYHLSLCNDFAPFLEGNWSSQTVQNRGLVDDPPDAPNRKTAVQKKITLERMLGLIAQFAPSLLRNDIIKRSTNLAWIWQRIRRHFNFVQSEVNFLNIANISRKPDERYETFYQRIVAHLEDNLLTVASGLHHDGAVPTTDEVMSPTTERLAVYLWLSLIDNRLPSYVARVYAHDLQSCTLKDIQPRLSQSMDSLLAELSTQEDIQIHYAKSRYHQHPNNRNGKGNRQKGKTNKQCFKCKSVGRPHTGHDINECWFVSKFEKMEIAKAFQVTVDQEDDELDPSEAATSNIQKLNINPPSICSSSPPTTDIPTVQKVECDTSPFFFAFFKHHPCHVVIDTGATSSVVSQSFVHRVGIPIKSTLHSARSADKSNLPVLGEVHFTMNFGDHNLPITALVIEKLDCDILAGIPFCKHNDIHVHLKAETISINTTVIPYGSKHSPQHPKIRRVNSVLLRNNSEKVLMPGEYLEFEDKSLLQFDGEVAIEPHLIQPTSNSWIQPTISRVIDGTLRIPNLTSEPIQISKSQHVAQIRPIIDPDETLNPSMFREPVTPSKTPCEANFTNSIAIDPDSILTAKTRSDFKDINERYHSIFDPNFGVYNDKSGPIRADINLGPVEPPPQKGKLPFYNQSNLQLLQQEADRLEELGVLAKPEDIGVNVKFVSPSFLRKKPDGSYRFVTAFNNLGQYVRITPTATMSSDEVLRRLSMFKYVVKTDFTKSFFQIPLAKNSIPYLGTVTPFKGLRVYLRSAMGMPGSSEFLQELTSRVFGDFITEGFLTVIADDLFIGGNTEDEILRNYERVLQRIAENNLSLSAVKTIICPRSTTILGWHWSAGTLSPSSHKTAAFASVSPPKTCSAMRSYIGTFKAISLHPTVRIPPITFGGFDQRSRWPAKHQMERNATSTLPKRPSSPQRSKNLDNPT